MGIVFFGAPGSGKGTQADMLAAGIGFKKVSLGDILREEAKTGSQLGREVKQYMDKGELAPDSIVSRVIEANLNCNNFILDGYPRNRSQAEELEKILQRKNFSMDLFIYLEISQKTAVNRLSKRRVCQDCRSNYHLDNMPPQEEGVCDHCRAGLFQRDDDYPEVIKKRWGIFLENSREIFQYYKDKGVFAAINGEKEKEEILRELKQRLKSLKA